MPQRYALRLRCDRSDPAASAWPCIAAVAAGSSAAAAATERLTALAPTLDAAGRLATLESLRTPLPPAAGSPCARTSDWGEPDARFGAYRGGRMHEGQDVFAQAGTPLVAIRDGRIVEKGDDGGRGNYVAIWSADARRTFVYLHMLRPPALRAGRRA